MILCHSVTSAYILCLTVLSGFAQVGKMFLVHKTMKFFFKFDKDEHAEMHT